MLNMIASVGKNNELGKNGDLIWRIKDDLIFFRNMTLNHDIIMGRKTFESLPGLLDKRKHIVLTNRKIDGVETINDIKVLILRYQDKDAFVIGGESLYRQFIDYATKIYLTEIDSTSDMADTFFPEFDKALFDREVLKSAHDEKFDVDYSHILYKRK